MSEDLTLDFETRSTVDLKKTGVSVYAESPNTHVWCAAYAFGDGEVSLWREGEPCPPAVSAHIRAGGILRAFNSFFEMNILHYIMGPRFGWPIPEVEQYRCTMTAGMAMALPGSLKMMGAALGLSITKDDAGQALMLRMARPRKIEDDGTVIWWNTPDKLEKLWDYCRQDVAAERAVAQHILPLRASELALWHLDQKINMRGIHVDTALCHRALAIVDTATKWCNDELSEITNGAVKKLTAVAQLIAWLGAQGISTESLDKTSVSGLLERADLAADVRRVLELRSEAGGAAVKKIGALLTGTSRDSRARGLLQFHAASTGRWAGRRFQPQNIRRNRSENVDEIIDAIGTGSAQFVQLLHGEPLAAVSDCLRGMVGAAAGHTLYAADFSNVEGRLTAWLAGEEWKLDAFRDFDRGVGHDIYKLAYARSFGISPADVDKSQRQIGKVMELALGYQGGVGAFQKMAVGYGVTVEDERADELKNLWREAHPNIVQFWYDLENAAVDAIKNPGVTYYAGYGQRIAFRKAGTFLYMRLPSGRAICYPFACMKRKLMPWTTQGKMILPATDDARAVYEQLPVWKDSVCYKAIDPFTRQWSDQFAHGGLLANNAVQGTARDIEAEAMVRVERAGYPVVLSVHDEVVSETAEDFGSLNEFVALMETLPDWAEGLPLAASGFKSKRYRK